MKKIKPTNNEHQWPRSKVESVECRNRDLVIRITNWMDDKDEPAFDVECYIGGVYNWNESKTFTLREYKTPDKAKFSAIQFSQSQTSKLL